MAADLKDQTKALMQERDRLELEIAERSARLEAAGVGMKGQLVDKEGYPRADIDVPAVRLDRHRIIVLTNDHKALTQRIDGLLAQLHAAARKGAAAGGGAGAPEPPKKPRLMPSPAGPAPAQSPPAAASSSGRPFAVVDQVAEDSPAAAAGVQLGDQLLQFGAAGAAEGLQGVAAELQANEGRVVPVVFLRQGRPVTLHLRPATWPGRGLLGCHLRPL